MEAHEKRFLTVGPAPDRSPLSIIPAHESLNATVDTIVLGERSRLVGKRQKQQIATAIASAAMVGGILAIGTPASAAPAPTGTVSATQGHVGNGTQAHRLLPDKPCKHNCNKKPKQGGNTQGGTQGGGGGNTQGGTQGGGGGNTQGGTQGGGR
ncbi:hypothetical protein ACWCPJ_36870, partial [Streptomyces collinus]